MFLFADDLTLYRENHKHFTKNLVDIISEFSEVAGYKINMQKLVAFSYPNDEFSKKEKKKLIPILIASKPINAYPSKSYHLEWKDRSGASQTT